MNRGRRERSIIEEDIGAKIIKYITIGIGILTIIIIGLLVYSKSLNEKVKSESLSSKQIENIVDNLEENETTESASTEIGRSINEVANELNSTNTVNSNQTNTATNSSNILENSNTTNVNTNTNSVKTESSTVKEQTNNTNQTLKTLIQHKRPLHKVIIIKNYLFKNQ